MRTNLPVTNVEKILGDETLIVSKTDLKGKITYINRDFIEISGFSEQELLGEPHNIVRHPDMPVEAFQDLWNTLKQGRPWTGYVKNRCKNGDHYWVLANAAPIVENGQVTGYISVRRKVERQTIEQVEKLYRLFREKRQGGLKIRYGQAVRGFVPNVGNVGIAGKLWGGMALVVLVALIAIAFAWNGMHDAQRRFTGFVEQEQKLAHAYEAMDAQGLQMGQALRNIVLDPGNRKAYENLEQARREFQLELDSARAVSGGEESIRKGLEQIATLRSKQASIQERVLASVAAGDVTNAKTILNDEDNAVWRENKQLLIDQRQLLEKRSAQGREEVRQAIADASQRSLAFGALALIVGAFVAAFLARHIRRPMEEMADTFANVLQGRYTNVVDITRDDEIGRAMQGLQILQTRMGFEVAETKRQADEMTRIKIALDNVSTGVMIADRSRNIIYANKSVVRILKAAESDIRTQLPNFSADRLVGTCIDTFHRRPEHQARLLAELSATHKADLELGGRHMTVQANPVINERGERLGAVAEWTDRTAEVMVESEAASIVEAAANGDFSRRFDIKGKEGFFLQLGEQMNRLLDNSERGLNEVAEVMAALAKGDLRRRMDGEFAGTFGRLQQDVGATVDNLQEIVGAIKQATDAINTAAREIAAGNTDLSSRTEEQASSLEETASSMEQLTSTVKQNADNARQANELANSAQEVATRGGEVVGQVVQTMGAIHQASSKISDIIGVIDGIAFQTNILALNAAVEAARAGEQGRGFAVVATEVRNLAQRSAAAAKEIKGLISDSVEKVQAGTRLVDNAGKTMEEVVTSIRRVARIMTDISDASREQSSGIEQVSLAVSQMDEVTQQNAALVEEAAAAAESLEEQARELTQVVSVFRVAGMTNQRALSVRSAPLPETAAAPHVAHKKQAIPLPATLDDEWEEF